ncbi:regulatory LuxR family protein [Aestuariispira insulae]|uniref:Regulatory LuxR family protein n=2 Tax=Aestuariispira insulae TaxID=1461337 RepID=A0A3D9HXZ5_9PROT|nr:regulatory LuxR family protein [Aestuariispira insulae]
MPNTILLVEDDKLFQSAFVRKFKDSFNVLSANDATEGLTVLERHKDVSVIITDMMMPGLNGVEFLEKTIECSPYAVRIMLTGSEEQKTAVDAVNRGNIFRFLNKPCSMELLMTTIEEAIDLYDSRMKERALLEQVYKRMLEGTDETAASPSEEAEVGVKGRQLDCLKWAIKGKTYEEISIILGISARTVRHYIIEAREAYGYASTTQALVRASKDFSIDPS